MEDPEARPALECGATEEVGTAQRCQHNLLGDLPQGLLLFQG
jgi:hypothetical protein